MNVTTQSYFQSPSLSLTRAGAFRLLHLGRNSGSFGCRYTTAHRRNWYWYNGWCGVGMCCHELSSIHEVPTHVAGMTARDQEAFHLASWKISNELDGSDIPCQRHCMMILMTQVTLERHSARLYHIPSTFSHSWTIHLKVIVGLVSNVFHAPCQYFFALPCEEIFTTKEMHYPVWKMLKLKWLEYGFLQHQHHHHHLDSCECNCASSSECRSLGY